MIDLEPEPGVVLVKLNTSEYGAIPIPDRPHDTQTNGVVNKLNKLDAHKNYLIGRTVYFQKYQDDARVFGGDKFAFIKITDLLGSSYDTDASN